MGHASPLGVMGTGTAEDTAVGLSCRLGPYVGLGGAPKTPVVHCPFIKLAKISYLGSVI